LTESLNEADVYDRLKLDVGESRLRSVIPSFISRAEYKGSTFIELEDLVTRFDVDYLSIMDLKLGTRTFLESEVQNSKPRHDLFEKMKKIDPKALTEEELSRGWITKLRYMTFREELSSTRSLGFRIEGVKIKCHGSQSTHGNQLHGNELHGNQLHGNQSQVGNSSSKSFQQLGDESEIRRLLIDFAGPFREEFASKLVELRDILESSLFFQTHEMIGSSLLLIHDHIEAGVWLIDFAKTFNIKHKISHRGQWTLGNHEDGVLVGIDNLVRLFH
jgi:1D-myo-inositol-triphosphate 3-kinase